MKSFWIYAGAVLTLLVLGIIETGTNFPAFMVVSLLATLFSLGFLAYHFPRIRWPIVFICVILILGSGLWEYLDLWELPLEVRVDNSVTVVQPPNSQESPEFSDWFKKKVQIGPGQGAQRAFLASWLASVLSYWVLHLATLALIRLKIPALRRIQIPLELIFPIFWVLASVYLISTPVNSREMDQATANALNSMWWLGFTNHLWWMLILSGLSWVIAFVRNGGYASKVYPVSVVIVSFTWLLSPLVNAVFDPTLISWTICSGMLSSTSLTNALCQEAYAAGKMTVFAVSMLWGWLISLFP